MKENMLDVLMYLFENFMDNEEINYPEQSAINGELVAAGFEQPDIDKALNWLEDLSVLQQDAVDLCAPSQDALRVFSDRECKRMDADCRGFLMFLDQMGIIDPTSRELIVDRVMALEAEEIDLDQVKWVAMMVLFNRPGQEAAFAWLENLVYNEMEVTLH